MKTVVSFGGGVQSTALAIMCIDGRLPRPDLFMFADTGDEPVAVYEHVQKWKHILECEGFEFKTVRKQPEESLSDHVLNRLKRNKAGISYPPLYVERKQEHRDGRMPLWRGCTRTFKSRVLDQETKKWASVPRGYKGPPMVEKWLGISIDESSRMRLSTEKWYTFKYPLIDLRVSRTDCIGIIKKAGESAPRSACVYCPFHSNREWRRVRSVPEDWNKAVNFEKELHRLWDEKGGFGGLKSRPTLHESGVPLSEANIDEDQVSLFSNWDNECAGICGV